MPPANERLILLPPRRALVGGVADDAGGAELRDGDALDGIGLRRRKHDLSLYILAGVIALARSIAYVDEITGHIGAVAVLGERNRRGIPTGHACDRNAA